MLNGKNRRYHLPAHRTPELSRLKQLGIAGFEAYAPLINKNVSSEKV